MQEAQDRAKNDSYGGKIATALGGMLPIVGSTIVTKNPKAALAMASGFESNAVLISFPKFAGLFEMALARRPASPPNPARTLLNLSIYAMADLICTEKFNIINHQKLYQSCYPRLLVLHPDL